MRKMNVLTLLLTCGLAVGGNGMPVLAAGQEADVPARAAQEKETVESVSANDIMMEKTVQSDDKAETEEETGGTAASGKEPSETETGYVNRVVSFTDYTGMRVTYDANASRKYVYEVSDGVLKAVKEKEADRKGQETLVPVSFEGNVELKQPEKGDKYTSVSADVFGGNQKITYVKLPAGITIIAEDSFKGCTALKSIYLPSTVKEISAGAFEDCTAMTQLSIPKSVSVIGDNAFKGDAKLKTLQLRDAQSSELTSIGADAFAGCESLEQITMLRPVTTAGDDAVQGERAH